MRTVRMLSLMIYVSSCSGKISKYTLIADLLLTCMLLTTTIYFPLATPFLMEVGELLLLEEKGRDALSI